MPGEDPRSHADGVSGGVNAGIYRQLDHLTVEELAELRIDREPGLVAAVVGLGRSPDRGEELGSPDDFVDNGGNVMRPAAGTKKREAPGSRAGVAGRIKEKRGEVGLSDQRRRQRGRARVSGGAREQAQKR